ncbi:MAG: DUF2283 domain-containing protein [Candidatus Parabeggiatoa sp. nov. 2]|nr:MAG: DNA polymerase III subunit alpha [Beggiatoa sp. 4572_84]RKZ60419.1 MAG: DUF2283 domain-containing protein [Gammaproteobacteria bacterium]
MNNANMTYFKEEDVLYLAISEGEEAGSVELYPNMTAELNDKGELIGIEILDATTFIRDYILETAQVKLLSLPVAVPSYRVSNGVSATN